MPEPHSRLTLLRARTRAAHASIETVPAMARLMAPDLTLAEYIDVLQCMYAFHDAVEPPVARALRQVPEAAPLLTTVRMDALVDDLAWFGVRPSLPTPALPGLTSMAAALGALYVVEGSNLGGRIIGRHVSVSLGVSDGAGGSFYCGHGAETARARWQTLCALLEGPIAGPAAADETIAAAACDTFDCLERWMRRIDVASSRRPMADAVAT